MPYTAMSYLKGGGGSGKLFLEKKGTKGSELTKLPAATERTTPLRLTATLLDKFGTFISLLFL